MSELAKYGNHFVIGLQPTTVLGEHDRRLLSTLRPAGVIVFKGNFRHDLPYDDWLAEYDSLLRDVAACLERDRFLLCIDHEGGRVLRPPQPITRFAFSSRWAERAGAVGAAVGVELASLGINVNFAPVVDVDSNPLNPVIAKRAFSDDPDVVAEAASAYIDALQAAGVLACPKHFPGHGDTVADSHLTLPHVDEPLTVLRERELKPFRRVVDRVRLIMTAHIIFDYMDPELPATFSHRALTGILRGELGFGGVVISDDLGMKAVDPYFAASDAALRAVLAGCDLLEVCASWTDTRRALGMAESIANHARDDETVAALEASRARIEKLLASVRTPVTERLPDAMFEQHSHLAPLNESIPRAASTPASQHRQATEKYKGLDGS